MRQSERAFLEAKRWDGGEQDGGEGVLRLRRYLFSGCLS